MAQTRAIVKRLKAIRNIRKITRTMELIATARFKQAMDRASQAEAYTRKISELVADLSASALEVMHPLLQAHEKTERAGLLVLTSNRGLCGGYNANVLRVAWERYQELHAATALRLEVSGKRGVGFFRFRRVVADQVYTHFEDKPRYDEVELLADRYIAGYVTGKLDRLDVGYTRFFSAGVQRPVVETLLPMGSPQQAAAEAALHPARADSGGAGRVGGAGAAGTQYEFLPSARDILEEIVPVSFKIRLFKCFLDAAVSEQIARRAAMKAATENADEMLRDLTIKYNRARQAQITKEISEIIGGAEALK